MTDVHKVEEGWDNEVYEVGLWMFRFPRHVGVLPWLERELRFMPAVADAIGVAVPRFEKVGRRTEAFPYPFVGYRRVPGVAADIAPTKDLHGLSRDLGTTLSRLHAIDPSVITMRTPSGWENETWEDWRTFDPEDAADIAEVLPSDIAAKAVAHLAGDVPPPPFDGERRVIHNDIGADHVLVDADTGRLTGLIDFSDLIAGDPAADFAGLITIGDRAFIAETLDHYGGSDPGMLDRSMWASRVLTLIWIEEALDQDDLSDKHLLWVERAFA